MIWANEQRNHHTEARVGSRASQTRNGARATRSTQNQHARNTRRQKERQTKLLVYKKSETGSSFSWFRGASPVPYAALLLGAAVAPPHPGCDNSSLYAHQLPSQCRRVNNPSIMVANHCRCSSVPFTRTRNASGRIMRARCLKTECTKKKRTWQNS
jgi:hypothetical protein